MIKSYSISHRSLPHLCCIVVLLSTGFTVFFTSFSILFVYSFGFFNVFLSLSPFFFFIIVHFFPYHFYVPCNIPISPFILHLTSPSPYQSPSISRGCKTFVHHWSLAAVIHAQSPMRAVPIRAHPQSIRAETGFRKTDDHRSNDGNGRSSHYLRVMR